MALPLVNMLGFSLIFLPPETKGRSLEEVSGEDSGRKEDFRDDTRKIWSIDGDTIGSSRE